MRCLPGRTRTKENPCLTIVQAIKRAEEAAGPNTIELSAEENPYTESISLLSPKDAGLTINGEEPGVVIAGNKAPGMSASFVGSVTLSNLTVRASILPALLRSAIIDKRAALTLDNVVVENESTAGENGIEALEHGSVTVNGGKVIMSNGATGYGVEGFESAVALNGVTVASEALGEAGGVNSEKSPSLSLANTKVIVESTIKPSRAGIAAGHDALVSMQSVVVNQNDPEAIGVVLEQSPAMVNGLRVEMGNASDKAPAVLSELETAGASSTFSHLEVGGAWSGFGLLAVEGEVTLTDSRVA